MLNSSVSALSRQTLDIIDDHFLSAITTLFIEEMTLDRQSVPHSKSCSHPDLPLQPCGNASIAPLPCSKQTEALTLKEYGTRKAQPHHAMRRSRTEGTACTLRTFILGLSDAFNNLLMGIWGNLSLVGMTVGESDPVFHRVTEMEHMIQIGSGLINAVFGYLGERRMVAKNIRLNQLIQEINGVLPVDSDRFKKDILSASLIAPVAQNGVATLASNISRILRQFVERLDRQCDLILNERPPVKRVSTRLRTVTDLLGRIMEIITLLDRYAGVEPLKIKKLSTKDTLVRLAHKFEARFPGLKICLDLPRRLPRIHGDRAGLQFVLNQMMDNAAGAMSGQGRLHISANRMDVQPPRSWCLSRRRGDSIVIAVSDTGHGMDLDTLLHVFDPFFSHRRSSDRLGMGMAASWGIVKAHGGYIHVRSKASRGSAFKVYLPIR